MLAHQNAQILREWCIRLVDRLILADETAQIGRNGPCPVLELRILQDLVRLDGKSSRRERHEEGRYEPEAQWPLPLAREEKKGLRATEHAASLGGDRDRRGPGPHRRADTETTIGERDRSAKGHDD